jgi:hypothetical protein
MYVTPQTVVCFTGTVHTAEQGNFTGTVHRAEQDNFTGTVHTAEQDNFTGTVHTAEQDNFTQSNPSNTFTLNLIKVKVMSLCIPQGHTIAEYEVICDVI